MTTLDEMWALSEFAMFREPAKIYITYPPGNWPQPLGEYKQETSTPQIGNSAHTQVGMNILWGNKPKL